MVRIDVEVERDVERAADSPGVTSSDFSPQPAASAATAMRQRQRASPSDFVGGLLNGPPPVLAQLLVPFGPHQAILRSKAASSAKRAIASAESTTTAANVRAVWSWAEASWIR